MQNRTGGEEDWQNRTDRRGLPEEYIRDSTARTLQLGQDSQNRTARIGQSGQDSKNCQKGTDIKNRQNGTGSACQAEQVLL
jgi:hypothetical protein